MAKYSLETVREVWDNQDGSYVEIGPDRDGLNLVEIRYYERENSLRSRMSIPAEEALLVADAIISCANECKEDS